MPQLEVAIVGRLNNKAIVDENGALLVTGTGGGGGGITQAQAQAAFEAALDSRDITQGKYRKSNLKRVINTTYTIVEDCFSYSVANVGTGNATIDTGVTNITLKPNEVINSEAGSANNMFVANSISIDATGTEVILSFIS
jgi:hypothetical protein